MEHPGPIVPVREDALVRPALADDIVQPDRLQLCESVSLRCGDVGLPDVRIRIEHVRIGGSDVPIATQDRGLRAAADTLAQRRQPRELVVVVLRIGNASIRDID